MKQYVIDELRPEDGQALGAYLGRSTPASGVEGLYWLPIPEDMWTREQQSHQECQPFFFALELLSGRLVCELLVRTCSRVRCSCIAYASPEQREWLIETVDAMLAKRGIKV